MRRSFPKARFFTILRHPCDVVLSAKRFWGYDEAGIWWSLGLMAYLVAHPLSPVEYAVDFDELVQNSETTVRNLFAYLDVPYVDGVLEAFSERYAAASDRKSPETHNWSRRHEWHELDPTRMNPMYTNSIVGLYAKFGKDIEFPDHFSEVQNGNTQDLVELDSALLSDSESPERRIHNLQQVIRNQDAQIGKLHQDFAKRERENYLLWQEQRSWIAELEKAKAWLEEQRDNWQRLAEERERIVQEQRAWIAELEQGKA
jgi:hypothetical protein